MSAGVLRLKALKKSFDTVTAVDSVSLEVPRGQMLGIIGRSGAGKSTLLRLINRMTDPTAGAIVYGNDHVERYSGRALLEWRMQCAMIFQQFNLMPRLDVLTNVMLGRVGRHATLPSLFKKFSAVERARAIELLDRLDLVDHAFQRAETLSGGQQQRVAIARAQMQAPRILLADEPIASLDPRSASRVMDALRTINREDGLTVLCNLHTLETARQYCDRIVGLADGRLVFDGTPAALGARAVREIYQITGDTGNFNEEITGLSTEAALAPIPRYANA
jgi:phosphonate transport system ATP-binding protein